MFRVEYRDSAGKWHAFPEPFKGAFTSFNAMLILMDLCPNPHTRIVNGAGEVVAQS